MKNYRWNKKKFAVNMMVLVCGVFTLYFAVSYIDICAHNLDGGSNWSWNFFNLLFK